MPPPLGGSLSARGPRTGSHGPAPGRGGGASSRVPPASARGIGPSSASGAAAALVEGRPTVDIWQGRAFYVQLERCSGIADKVVSVRLDETKYLRQSEHLKAAIEQYFDKQLLVEVVDIPVLYAFEVRLMPEEAHPRNGRVFAGREAVDAWGGVTIFSKAEARKWPKPDAIIQQLQEFCRVPVRVKLRGRELKADDGSGRQPPASVHAALNGMLGGGAPGADSRPAIEDGVQGHATIICTHSRGEVRELHTDAIGEAQGVFHPGNFVVGCEADSNYDMLTPAVFSVPARFALMEIVITATMKKKCTFFVIDHLNRPFPHFPLHLRPKDPTAERLRPVRLQTKANGRGKARLGRGVWVGTYDAAEGEPREVWPVSPPHIELEVLEAEVPQFFRICVHRVRFTCEIMLRTRFQEPVALCPFVVRGGGGIDVARRASTDIGVAFCDLPAGRYACLLEAPESSPFVPQQFDINVSDDGAFSPLERVVDTKTAEVRFHLVTPDGEAAAGCMFHLAPQFGEGGGPKPWELTARSDGSGLAMASVILLEPYVFRVKDTGRASEYMPQEFVFLTDRRDITVVVARSVLGPIPERRVVLLVDTSGSMAAYLSDVKAALNLALLQQFHGSDRLFTVMGYSGHQQAFSPSLIDCTTQNIEDAMRFCELMEAGGTSNILEGIRQAFKIKGIEAVYVITDGKCDVGEEFLAQVRALYFRHPARPRIHTVSINCVPQRLTYKGLQALASMTQASFRPICLQQEVLDPAADLLGPGGGALGPAAGLDLSAGRPHDGTTTEEDFSAEGDDDIFAE